MLLRGEGPALPVPVPIPVGMDVPGGRAASLGMLLPSCPGTQGLQSWHCAVPDAALRLGSAGDVASRDETMPGWKGLSWFYVWSWLQLATSAAGAAENGAPLPSPLSWCGRDSALVPSVLPFTVKFVVSPQSPRLTAKGARVFLRERLSQHLCEQGDALINRSLDEMDGVECVR